jgi:fumarate reductase flavoprotein subunit
MKRLETDVAIIGGGTAGLPAAVAAAERGARVIVLEKASTTGGTGNQGMGPFAVESRLQKGKKGALTRDEAFKIFMDYTHWRVDARLVRAYIDKSGDTISWLEKMGVEFYEVEEQFPGANCTHHNVKLPAGGTGAQASAVMMKVMTDRAKELGAQILLQTQARKILKEGGRITGVMAEDKSGEEIQAKTKAVIISTGGFGDSPELIKKYTGWEWGKNIFSMRVPGMSGEGLHMAWEAGAAQSEMTMQIIFSLVPPFAGRGGARPELAAFRQPNLIVNLFGERIMNEEVIGNTTFTGNAVARQKNSCGFIIFDEDTKRDYEKNGMHFADSATAESIDANIQQAFAEGCDSIYIAGSLEELAGKTGINLNGLQKTVDEYNQACDEGRDVIFNKNPKYLRPVRQPRFYAAKLIVSAYGSLGGIRVNSKLEVFSKAYEVIPGLYAAGTDANTICGDSYVYVLPGTTMGFALNSGRMAGENAADYIKTIGQ